VKWRFSLNTNIIEDPIGWETGTTEIRRQDDIKGILYTYLPDLTFHSYGYKLILNELNNNHYCTPIDVLIEIECNDDLGAYETFFEGYIFLTDCSFDLEQCTVICNIVDQSYVGLIESNRHIEATVNVARSKNDMVMTAASPINITFFTPCSGLNGSSRKNYLVYDCFKMLVEFMTDGAITFDSTLFGAGGDLEGITITTGEAIRNAGSVDFPPRFSFKTLFDEMWKKYNISFYIDNTTTIPVLYVERFEDLYESSTVTTLDRVRKIEVSLDADSIFSGVILGSTKNQRDEDGCLAGPPAGYAHPDGRFFGHKEETYHTLGQCRVDNILDLSSDWIIDSNVIEDILINDNDEYDDDIIIIESGYPGTNIATKGDQFGATVRTYNPGLSNQATLENHFGSIPQAIAAYLGTGNDKFKAERLADISGFASISGGSAYPIEIYDANNNYNNATYRYVAPLDGAYTFEIFVRAGPINWGPKAESGDIDLAATLEVDRGAGFVVEGSFTHLILNAGGSLNIQFSKTFYLGALDEVRVGFVSLQDTGPGPGTNYITLKKETSFACIQAIDGGGIYETFGPEDVRMVIYDFEYPLSLTDFKGLLSGNRQKISFNDMRGFSDTGWLESLTYDVQQGTGKWTIRSKNDLRP